MKKRLFSTSIPVSYTHLARSTPGYFLPYTVGYLKMIDMRETAESELGSSFDATEYHTFIMNLGITSIDVYEKALDIDVYKRQNRL